MSYSNGLLPLLSSSAVGQRGLPGLPGVGLKLTDYGNFDIDGKRLTKIATPVDNEDASTKDYVDIENVKQNIAIADKASKNDLISKLNIDGSNSMTGNLNMNNNKAINLSEGTDTNDSVNYGQLINHTTDHKRDYQLASNFKFYRDFGDKGALTKSSQAISGHQHLDLYDVGVIEGRDAGFGGESWSSLKVTNTLGRGIYTIVFETFSFYNNILNDETLLYSVHGDAHFQIITFSHDWESNRGKNTPHFKAYIQFSSDGQPGEIKFQIRYYGKSFNNSLLNLFFYSRVLKGKHNNTFDHQLFDVKESQYDNEFLFFEDINMNGNLINNLGNPIDVTDNTNKSYVDGEISKVNIDTTPLLLRDGSRTMTGDLDMDKNHILFVENLSDYKFDDPLEYRAKDIKSVVNKGYLNINFLKIKDDNGTEYFDLRQNTIKNCEPYYDGLFENNDLVSKVYVDKEIGKLPKPETDVLKLDGSKAMTGDLNMGGKAIKNIKPFVEDDSSQAAFNAQKNEVINFGYFHTQRGELTRLINQVASEALNRKNPDPMQDNIDMANHSIINLKDPQVGDNTHAATVNFVHKSINDSNYVISTLIDKKIFH